MATILSSKKSTHGGPYCFYTVEASTSKRTPTSVKVTVKVTAKLQYSTSWLGTGYGLKAGIYYDGEWHEATLKSTSSVWEGTGAHTATITFTVSGLTASKTSLTGIKFRCKRTDGGNACELDSTSCSSISITNISKKYADVAIKLASITQAKAKVTLSSLPKSVGFATKIIWYRGSTKVKETSISATATATSYSYTFTDLLPNTAYTFKAVIRYDTSTDLVTKSVAETTPQETGKLTLTPQATYIKAAVTGMFNDPNYTRAVGFYVKKSEESNYSLFKTVNTQGTSASTNITGLISNVSYDVKVLIKNGSKTLKTLTNSAETIEDTSLIPTGFIEDITQQLGTRLCTLAWGASKSVAGTTYVVEAMSEGESEWEELARMSEVKSPATVEATSGNVNVMFRIKAVNESVAAGLATYSEEFTFYVRDDFLWDSDKIAGQPMIITANEWNRLRDYAIARNSDKGEVVNIPIVRQGDNITAEVYNTMKNAISNVTPMGVADKRSGDAITAADIDALRIAINAVA